MTTDTTLELDIYLNFSGNCAEAFGFYELHLGGKLVFKTHHQQIPPGFPPEWKNPVLHAIIEIGNVKVRGADIPKAEPMRSAYLTLRFDSSQKAEEIYHILSQGGEVFMKMEKTFFSNRFAMLRDKFGISWMLLHEN